MSNEFNRYYGNVGRNLANKITKPSTLPLRHINQNTMFMEPTNKHEVEAIIKTIKNNKTPGLDGLRAETLKCISCHICEPLAYLINQTISMGEWPRSLKEAIIKPLFKSGDKTKMVNYRPVSIISNIAKIFEKVIKQRLEKYVLDKNIISNRQFGFQTNKSTEDAISLLVSNIYEALDRSKPTLCVFLDLAKAFDTVSHPQLLDALEDIGLRGNVLDLMKSYISNRQQYVKIGNCISDAFEVKFGVPQGTVLGPILFTIYINNLLELDSRGKIISFADDTAILYQADSWKELKDQAENDMKSIKDWMDYNLLTINFEKTKYITFSCLNRNLPDYETLKIDENYEIERTDYIKYLGIIIDRHLRWDKHIDNLSRNLRCLLYKFRLLRTFLDTTKLKMVYHALVSSRLNYGIIGWGGAMNTHLKKISIIQKKILKIILRKPHTYPTDILYTEAKIFDIKQSFYRSIVVYQFKNKSSLQSLTHQYDTRNHGTCYKTPFSAKTVGQRSFAYLAPRMYQILPKSLRELHNLRLFRKKLNEFIAKYPRNELVKIIDMRK